MTLADFSDDDYRDFWDWKRKQVVFKMTQGHYAYAEFLCKWDDVKNKTSERPEKGTVDMTDLYFWRTSAQSDLEFPALPSEHAFREYYKNHVITRRAAYLSRMKRNTTP
jgi:hypothetical protein